MSRRKWLVFALISVMLVLSGCGNTTAPINPENGIWDRYFVYPLSKSLDWFADLFGGQYGLSILIVTVIIRLIILPLTLKQYKSSKRMQEIQPELKKIKEKHKDNPQKQQEETMKLFQSQGVNPLAGCLPIFIQMPILIALYNAIVRNSEISGHTFLWMQLGEKDPYYILPLIAALTTFIQQKMMSSQMTAQMQSLMFIFPVLIFVMAMNFAAALPLYWIYSNIFTIVQTYFIYGRSQANTKGEVSK
ncbi:membrane protein insertase YidC [Paenibacillus gansuensis]|uniref:Membrane protein insertase YidC n=1 Tax=Paenibacillus gansuensis TaxID=306542 RepID=A0ABW5PLN2_9BACL